MGNPEHLSSNSSSAGSVRQPGERAFVATFGLPKTQALLIALALAITMALYVGMWREKVAAQEKILTDIARENFELSIAIENSRHRTIELMKTLASLEKEESLRRMEAQEAASASPVRKLKP